MCDLGGDTGSPGAAVAEHHRADAENNNNVLSYGSGNREAASQCPSDACGVGPLLPLAASESVAPVSASAVTRRLPQGVCLCVPFLLLGHGSRSGPAHNLILTHTSAKTPLPNKVTLRGSWGREPLVPAQTGPWLSGGPAWEPSALPERGVGAVVLEGTPAPHGPCCIPCAPPGPPWAPPGLRGAASGGHSRGSRTRGDNAEF